MADADTPPPEPASSAPTPPAPTAAGADLTAPATTAVREHLPLFARWPHHDRERVPVRRSWLAITRRGFAIAWRSNLQRKFVLFAWSPMFWFVPLFFLVGWVTDHRNSETVKELTGMIPAGEEGLSAALVELGMVTYGVDGEARQRRSWRNYMRSLKEEGHPIDDALLTGQTGDKSLEELWSESKVEIEESAAMEAILAGEDPVPAILEVKEKLRYIKQPPPKNPLLDRLEQDPESLRGLGWSLGFTYFFVFTQTSMLILVVSIVGPPLIARDRERIWQMYLSRPLGPVHYVVGKAFVIVIMVLLTTLAPALLLYLLTILFSPSVSAVVDTFAVVPKLLAVSMVIALPVSAVMIWISSRGPDERFATFVWLGVVLLGEIVYRLLMLLEVYRESPWVPLLSLRQCIVRTVTGILGADQQMMAIGRTESMDSFVRSLNHNMDWRLCAVFLVGLTLLAFWRAVANVRRLASR